MDDNYQLENSNYFKKEHELVITQPTYFALSDESAFFHRLQHIEGIRSVSGSGLDLIITLESQTLSLESLRELFALFKRYGLDLHCLKPMCTADTPVWMIQAITDAEHKCAATNSHIKMSNLCEFLHKIESEGFYLWKYLFHTSIIAELSLELTKAEDSAHARKKDGKTYALRNILNLIPAVRKMALSGNIFSVVRAVLGNDARPVKATLFDKTAELNWNLRWHQDNVIAVAKKIDVPGFHGWTEKVGIPHVRPPEGILSQMIAVRIHLDDCTAENGALMVIPGSHSDGRLDETELARKIAVGPHVVLPAFKPDVLFMRPLLIHCSKRADKPEHRRVLHIEYAASDLPGGLIWGE